MENLKNKCFSAIVSALDNSENVCQHKNAMGSSYGVSHCIEKDDLAEKLTIEISSLSTVHISKFVLTFSLVVLDDQDDDLLGLDHFFDDVFYGDCLVSSEGVLDDVNMFVGYFFDEHDENLAIFSNVDDRQ
jgi:hypothetical protein